MFTVTLEFRLNGIYIQQTIDRIVADSEDDACDVAYAKVKRETPEAELLDILSVEREC